MYFKFMLSAVLVFGFFAEFAAAQTTNDASKTVLLKDDLFWAGYNSCNYKHFDELIAEDVEFYHDKGGITQGKAALIDSIKNNICGNPNLRVRREADAPTIKAFPLMKGDRVYGVIVSGNHFFINSYDGQSGKREGVAKFMNLWLLEGGGWKMARVLSYDHNSLPYVNNRRVRRVSKSQIRYFEGQYEGAQTGTSFVKTAAGKTKTGILILTTGTRKYTLYPESRNLFFVKDRDLTFEFARGNKSISKMIIRENGKVVEEAVRRL